MSETLATPGTNGAAVPVEAPTPEPAPPPAAPELSPKEKRALREQVRREFKAAERERLEAGTRADRATSPEKAAAPAAPVDPDRTDAQRTADAAVFLRGVLMPLLAVLVWPFGYRLKLAEFTPEKAREDGAAWVPVSRRYRWVDLTILWAGVPARLVARVRELVERRPDEEASK